MDRDLYYLEFVLREIKLRNPTVNAIHKVTLNLISNVLAYAMQLHWVEILFKKQNG